MSDPFEHLKAHGYVLENGRPVRKAQPAPTEQVTPGNEVAELRAQVAALTAKVESFVSLPANDAKRVHAERIARIQKDMATVKALVAGTPADRVAMLDNMHGTPLSRLVELMELPTLVTIAHGLPARSVAALKAALGVNGAGMIPMLDAELVTAAELPKLTVVTMTRAGGSFPIPPASAGGLGMVIEAGSSATVPTAYWAELLAKNSGVSTAIASKDLEARPANEDEARRYVARKLTNGELVFDGNVLYAPAPTSTNAEAEAEAGIHVRKSVARVRAADTSSQIADAMAEAVEAPKRRATANERAEAKRNSALAEAIAEALDKRQARKAKAPSR